MSQPNKRRYKLSEVVTRIREEKPAIEVETDDGKVYAITPPELWPDEALTLSSTNPVAAARLVVDDYDAFVQAGGSAALVNAIVADYAGLDLGKLSGSSDS